MGAPGRRTNDLVKVVFLVGMAKEGCRTDYSTLEADS